MLPTRNTAALTPRQIEYCQHAWHIITNGGLPTPLDVSRATVPFSYTGYRESDRTVYLGANAYPESGALAANARLSMLACLVHEYAHAERHHLGFARPHELPDVLLDEAETSIHASFHTVLRSKAREDLVEDARDRLNKWLEFSAHRQAEVKRAS